MTTPLRLTRPLLLVGCGKMGSALLEGWLASGIAQAGIDIVEPSGAPAFAGHAGVRTHADAAALPGDFAPEAIVLAVKPQAMDDVLPAYARFAAGDCVSVSIAAGKTLAYFAERLGPRAAVVRAMPNTPAAIGQGITAAVANAHCAPGQVRLALALLEAVGEALPIEDEAQMDAVTAVSGSGPAYVFHLIECLGRAGARAGLPEDLARRLAVKTVAGAGALALASDEPPARLRENVTSPGGTTQAALDVLMAEDGLDALLSRAVAAAAGRSRDLAG